MLVRRDADGAIVIGQASHAWISGQLARAWGNADFPPPAPREEVCLAALQHDIGMAEWDLDPTLNPATGLPHSFLEMPIATHIGLWRAAPERLLSQSHYAALLVSMHGAALYERRDPSALDAADHDRVIAYLEEQRSLQHELATRLGLDGAELAHNQRLLRTWDGLSLAICLGWAPYVAQGVPGARGPIGIEVGGGPGDAIAVAPWPFAEPELRLVCEGRRLAAPVDSRAALRTALAAAPVRRLEFRLLAG